MNNFSTKRCQLNLATAATLLISGCSGSGGDTSGGPSDATASFPSPQAAELSGFGIANMPIYQSPLSKTDWYLQWNAGRAQASITTNCADCTVAAQGKTAAFGQTLTVQFPDTLTQDGTSDISIVVTHPSGEQTTYTLHAVPPDYPSYQMTIDPATAEGDIYLTANYLAVTTDPNLPAAVAYAMKLSNRGGLLFYARDEDQHGSRFYDFKKTVLPAGQVRYSFVDGVKGVLIVMDESMNVIDQVAPRPSTDDTVYPIDIHDAQILDNGHYLIGTSADKTVTNIPGMNGAPVKVIATGLQEINGGNVQFNWLSSDHPELYACSNMGNDYGAAASQDYAHWNSVALEADGDLIASFRHFSSVLKIARSDNPGAVRWILGGSCDQFHLTAEQNMGFQHYARRAPDGTLSIFDNNNSANGANMNVTHAAKYRLDELGKSVIAFQADPIDQAHFSSAMGSAQYFVTGELFVGWGRHADGLEDVTEWNPAMGKKTFQLIFTPGPGRILASYRAQKM